MYPDYYLTCYCYCVSCMLLLLVFHENSIQLITDAICCIHSHFIIIII